MSKIVWERLENVSPKEVSQGINVRQLWQGNAGAQAVVVEIAPGAQWEGIDLHQDSSEEVFVISGVFNDGIRDYPEGTFIHHPIGSSHVPQSKIGCKLFVFYPEKH